jgi:hypothetical protein
MTIWSILWPVEIFDGHLVYFVVIWYISPRFGILPRKTLPDSMTTIGCGRCGLHWGRFLTNLPDLNFQTFMIWL